MPALQIDYRPIESLTAYARNARTHSDEQVAQIAASIREFGFNNPVLVDGDNDILAGHGRLAGARKLGLTEVPVIELAHLSPTQKRAYLLSDIGTPLIRRREGCLWSGPHRIEHNLCQGAA